METLKIQTGRKVRPGIPISKIFRNLSSKIMCERRKNKSKRRVLLLDLRREKSEMVQIDSSYLE